MIAASEIRGILNQFIAGGIVLDDFEDWIVANSWNMHQDSDPFAQSWVSAIELRLAEHSAGHLSEQQMLSEFRALLDGRHVFNIRFNADPVVHRSGSSISVERVDLPDLVVGTQFGVVYELLSLHPK